MGKHAAGTGLQLFAGRVPEIGAAVGWSGSSSRLGQRFGTGVGEGVALALRGFYEFVVMLGVCVAAAREVSRVSE